ncbi:hypothetical protein APHAL10511_007596 [Amanita phalloides]|nr:hypothetical protein APHAL10511_007596 [Amanita phalloides]
MARRCGDFGDGAHRDFVRDLEPDVGQRAEGRTVVSVHEGAKAAEALLVAIAVHHAFNNNRPVTHTRSHTFGPLISISDSHERLGMNSFIGPFDTHLVCPTSMLLLSLLPAFALSAAGLVQQGIFQSSSLTSSCDASGVPSCSNSSDVANLCCFEYPGGLITLTQFWDTHPSTGPSDSWTIHGLWPNHCDGTYDQGCDPSRYYTDLPDLLTNQGAGDTLSFMHKYWVDIHGDNEHFWQHEWNKHGTCYSTLNPSCLLGDSPQGAEAVAFFQTVVKLYKQYNIYGALSNAGITPAKNREYSQSDLESALSTAFGVTPGFGCSHGRYLNEAYIWFNLQGSVVDGTFTAVNAPTPGNCGSDGILYVPKQGHHVE